MVNLRRADTRDLVLAAMALDPFGFICDDRFTGVLSTSSISNGFVLWMHDPKSDPSGCLPSFSTLWQSQHVRVPHGIRRLHHLFDKNHGGIVAHGTRQR